MSNREDSGRGRHRGRAKTPEMEFAEDKAKGHRLFEEIEVEPQEVPGVNPDSPPRARGNQKGFGKNQGKEATDRSTAHGTRASGAEHG